MDDNYVAFLWFALTAFTVWLIFIIIVLFVHYDYQRCADKEQQRHGAEGEK